MERAKAERTILRRKFSRTANDLEEALGKQECLELISALIEKLQNEYDCLSDINNTILTLWLDNSERDEQAMEQDLDSTELYDKRWFLLKHKAAGTTACKGSSKSVESESDNEKSNAYSSARSVHHNLRLPKIELPSFDGHIKRWIAFWAQFEKIHTDDGLSDDDKFHYLLQAMEKGSSAREMVESFPPCGKNYAKAISTLKERFAKEEYIIDYYVRELLQLVIGKSVNKLPTTALYDRIMTQIMALESLGLTQDKYASFLYPLVESALPDDMLRAWHRSHLHQEKGSQPLSKLLGFLKLEAESEGRIRAAKFDHACPSGLVSPTAACLTTSVNKEHNLTTANKKENTYSAKLEACIWCEKGFHSSSECCVAMKMSLEQRKEFLMKNRVCLICLRKGHIAKKCRKYPRCVVCGKRHYTLMCTDIPTSASTSSNLTVENKGTEEQGERVVMSQSTDSKNVSTVLLQTLKVKVVSDNKEMVVRALLDSGAQKTFVKQDVAKKLNLVPVSEMTISHNLFGGTVTKKRSHKIYNLIVTSLDDAYSRNMKVLEQPVLCGYLPQLKKESIVEKLGYKGIFLSDSINDDTEIGLLIGSDVLGTLWTGRLERVDNDLVAMETKLGWTIQGPTIGAYSGSDNQLTTLHASCGLGNVEDFWKLETLGINDDAEVRSKQAAVSEVQTFFKETVCRNDEDRYEVRLPWKAKFLESNYDLALKRLASTTNRLTRLGIVKDYDLVFREWLETGIIEEVSHDTPETGHYLCHHAVVRESSLTTKIRPVFDASATDKNGLSLNSCLEKGINLIEQIPRLLTQFRKNKIGITSDIKKAFLQIALHPDDRDYVKFLWWRDPTENPRVLQTFRHRRVVFGVTTSPYLLSATILHHLENYDCTTAALLRKCFYVDNCVVSVKNVDEMHQFVKEAINIMQDGKFELRCWVSGPEMIDKDIVSTSVLGLNWDPQCDELNCKQPSAVPERLTKRVLLSIAQSTFDPLGFLSPATIVPKVLIQKCWALNVDWDQDLPVEIDKLARDWINQLHFLGMCKVPRCLSTFDLDQSVNSLHIFCDASLTAYACCIFLRSEFENSVSVQLVLAKTRVAPTKRVTIPRIELLAALMGSRLVREVRNDLELSCKEYFWTDSSIVLAWLKKQTALNVFVHNRVKEIISNTNTDDWHHVPGELNPADYPSRGCNPKDLFESRWWEGPLWLKGSSWPVSPITVDELEISEEIVSMTVQGEVSKPPSFTCRFLYFSDYIKIVRTVSWCLRFISNCRKSGFSKGDSSPQEYTIAEKRLFSLIQADYFNNIEEVRKRLSLDICRGDDCLIRVKTRLTLSDYNTSDFINPILLPGKDSIVERFVIQKHKEFLHAGAQILLSKLRESVWIIGGRVLVKRVVRNCMVCKRFNAKRCSGPIPPLPVDRTRCGAPFQVSGVDFAGPLLLRSGEKCWIALFTCAVYRAVHLELCLSLSTEEFLLALRRFMARRGNVEVMYSDNGTNFRGACNVLRSLNWDEVQEKTKKTVWRFSPPSAPWWGGFWERMVRSIKDILKRVLGKAALEFNELVTVLCETESIINSRPLTSSDSNTELRALTPATFLLQYRTSDSSLIDIGLIDGHILSSRWRYLTKLCSDMKLRFRREYLGLLAKRPYLKARTAISVKPGDVVLIEANIKRVEWPLGIVKEILKGTDGFARVARVKTETGTQLKAIQNLHPLELNCDC